MRRGAWHQFGDKSQRLAEEQLQHGQGVGVIISPCNLALHKAIEYSRIYHALGADVLIDLEFYEPTFSNKALGSYPIGEFRASVSELHSVSDRDLAQLGIELTTIHSDLCADGIIAPAIVYEAARPDIVELNARLFAAAKRVGDELGIPTYATVMLGHSATSSDLTIDNALSNATSLDSDGWYYGFEFNGARVPSSTEAVMRCCTAGLTLACTGKPVLHAYAGPMALLSMGFGATGTGIGHFQNLWQFTRQRWQHRSGQGGGGDAPARFFSAGLWGTIVYPDEVSQLPTVLRDQVFTASPFYPSSFSGPLLPWDRWPANKHLVYVICSTVANIAANKDAAANAVAAITILQAANDLHARVADSGLDLRDHTNVYQENWRVAVEGLLTDHSADFEYLRLLA